MDYKKVVEELSTVFKTEQQASDYAYLVFMYNLDLVNNVLYHLHYKKTEAIKIPVKYKAAYYDLVGYYNTYYGGNNG